uniref:tRNA (adenine(58)-N(1))-methyltransferase n=1 Tax=Callorhinchus milii TaxID=7868 RepID=A0A4W3GBM4_CALMI
MDFVYTHKNGADANTMLMMMDVNHGDCVLEAGSGSGAMTLFLSRAVGTSGRVYSFEIREDHHSNAKKNYRRWRKAWEVSHEEEWPNNVNFINKDIASATEDLQGKLFDAIALDMINPQLALPATCSHLKQGHICAVYLANITQVIDLLEGVRSCQLPLVCERIIEVIQREWLVSPAKRKDGTTAPRVQPQKDQTVEFEEHREESDVVTSEDEGDGEEENKPFCAIPYIARPHHEQFAHTGEFVIFLFASLLT